MAKQFDNTSDQFLDGRSVCPGHALTPERARHYDCEFCEFPLGYNAAVSEQWAFRNDTSHRDIPMWEEKVKRVRGYGGGVCHYYWAGYCSYLEDMLCLCYEDLRRWERNAEEQQSVLEARMRNQNELGAREFTLTYSPAWFESDTEAQRVFSLAIQRLTKYYKDEIIDFHAVGEFGADGRSHVHGWYHLLGGLKITDKNFKRAYPRWNPRKKLGRGFEGGHHAPLKSVSNFSGYIEKHLDEAWLQVDINADSKEAKCTPSSSCSSSSQNDA